MTLDDKVRHAEALLKHFPGPHAVMSSFGKDSMVLLHLVRNVLPKNPLNAHAFPIPVLWHRHPYFPAKNEFAEGVIRSWAIEAHDYPPLACGVKCKEDMLELVARYPFGASGMDLPINTLEPESRRDFVCGVEWLNRPKQLGMSWDWATVFSGHKSADIDPYEGPVPLKHDAADAGGVNVVFPLRHWTDDDVWQYIDDNHIPYDKRRYAGHLEVPDKMLNPDYIHACVRCIDPRETADTVMCPKLGQEIPIIGHKVLRLDSIPIYVIKEEHAAVA